MQHCLEGSRNEGKTWNSQSSNGSSQRRMEQCKWSLVCWGSISSLVNHLGSSNPIVLVYKADQLFATGVEKLGIRKGIKGWSFQVFLTITSLSTMVMPIWYRTLVSYLVLYVFQLTLVRLLLCLLYLLHLILNISLKTDSGQLLYGKASVLALPWDVTMQVISCKLIRL